MVDENKTPSVSVAGKYFLLSQEQIVANCCMFDHNYILLDENIQFSWEDEIFLDEIIHTSQQVMARGGSAVNTVCLPGC